MDRRYQIFISSTFTDLIEERQAVLKAVLEIGHMPAGMELFPASDNSAWRLIKHVIDQSDYYVLIIGGRYGSQDDTGMSYTQKEYEYALSCKKPVIALLHEDPDKIQRGRTETEKTAWSKLQGFRDTVQSRHHCNYWTSAETLKAKVIIGLTSAEKAFPGVGWIRADQMPSRPTLNAYKVLDVLSNGRWKRRTLPGLSNDSGLSENEVLKSLNLLSSRRFVNKDAAHGRWAVTAEGRDHFVKMDSD